MYMRPFAALILSGSVPNVFVRELSRWLCIKVFICLRDSLLGRTQLLRHFEAGLSGLDHRDSRIEMAVRPFQTFDDVGMGSVKVSGHASRGDVIASLRKLS